MFEKQIIQILNSLGSTTGQFIRNPKQPAASSAPLIDKVTKQTVGRITMTDLAPSGNTVYENSFFQNTRLAQKLLKIKQ